MRKSRQIWRLFSTMGDNIVNVPIYRFLENLTEQYMVIQSLDLYV